MNYELICNNKDCGAVMKLVHGGHMTKKSIYHYCCPNDECDNWTSIEIEGDDATEIEAVD